MESLNVFVSHSSKDIELINILKDYYWENCNINFVLAEDYIDTAHTITQKIKNLILSCDIALIFLTDNGFNSQFVQQEIGYLEGIKKEYLPIIVKDLIDKTQNGWLYGRDCLSYNEQTINDVIDNELTPYLENKKHEKFKQKEKDKKVKNVVLGGLALLGLAALANDN